MSSDTTDTTTRPRLKRVQFELPRCPACDSDRLRVVKTSRTDDALGVLRQKWLRCADCGEQFVGEFS